MANKLNAKEWAAAIAGRQQELATGLLAGSPIKDLIDNNFGPMVILSMAHRIRREVADHEDFMVELELDEQRRFIQGRNSLERQEVPEFDSVSTEDEGMSDVVTVEAEETPKKKVRRKRRTKAEMEAAAEE